MTYIEIANIILTHKSLSKLNLKRFDGSVDIIYTLNDTEYNIRLLEKLNKVSLIYYNRHKDISNINIDIHKRCTQPESVVRNFKKMIKCIHKFDIFKKEVEDDNKIIIDYIASYVKNKYNFDILNVLSSRNYFSVSLCKTGLSYIKTVSYGFNFLKEKTRNYDINVKIFDKNTEVHLHFCYDSTSNNFVLMSISEAYVDFSNDITKIIRCEKLKNIINSI